MTLKPFILSTIVLTLMACQPTSSREENSHKSDINERQSDIIITSSDGNNNSSYEIANDISNDISDGISDNSVSIASHPISNSNATVSNSNSNINNSNSSTNNSENSQSNALYAYTYSSITTPAGNIMAGDLASVDSLQSKLPDDVTIKRGINHYEDEGEEWEESKLIVSTESEVLFDLPYSDWDGADIIERIVIHSPHIKNADNIGVGTSVSEFIRTYPNSKLYYTYVSESIWLENGVGSVEFILKPSDAVMSSIDIDSDWMELDPSILPATQKIDSIEIVSN